MRLLLDTQALLWLAEDSSRLSRTGREAFENPANDCFVSAVSLLEIAIKKSTGKLNAPDNLPDVLPLMDCEVLPVLASHAWRVKDLPLLHRDPFDRLIVAQALEENLTLVTADKLLRGYGIKMIQA